MQSWPMKILIVGNYRPDQQRSMMRFADMLVDNLRHAGVRADLIIPAAIANRWPGRAGRLARLAANIDKYLFFPLVLRVKARGYDCIHIVDHSNAPYAMFTAGRPTVLTCHDLFGIQVLRGDVPGTAFGLTGRMLQKLVLGRLRKARTLTAVSENSRSELQRLVNPRAAIAVVPNALSPCFAPQQTVASGPRLSALNLGPGKAFFLHVGGNQWYKNRRGVLRLFEQLRLHARFADHRLVFAGKAPDDDLCAAIAASSMGHAIDLVCGGTDADLAALYGRAEALLFVSLAEGFGWPIIEAQACRCVVVASDLEPLKAIAGNAAVLVDPIDPIGAAAKIAKAHDSFPDMRARGAANAQRYDAALVFRQYLPVYKAACAA